MLYLGIDSGTQSTKSIVLDLESGEILATAQQSYALVPDLPPGHMEQEPHEWINATEATILECFKQIGSRKPEVRAIGVSGQQDGLVVWNDANRVIGAAKLWGDMHT